MNKIAELIADRIWSRLSRDGNYYINTMDPSKISFGRKMSDILLTINDDKVSIERLVIWSSGRRIRSPMWGKRFHDFADPDFDPEKWVIEAEAKFREMIELYS